MSETRDTAELAGIIKDLRTFSEFADLPEDGLAWLSERMEKVQFKAGEVVAKSGDPLEHLIVLVEGELQIERQDSPGAPILMAEAGDVTGYLPFSRLTHYRGTARAVLPLRSLQLHKKHFPEMLNRMPLLGQRLVALMSDRIREVTRMETQQEKLMALGKLSAGLAHELNNPAAAAQRASQSLMKSFENIRGVSLRLLQYASTEEQRQAIFGFEMKAGQRFAAQSGPATDPLALSDREERVTSWLEKRGVSEPWTIAATLAEACVDEAELEQLAHAVGGDLLNVALQRVAAIITLFGLIREIENSTKRISDLVAAVKRYSYMDQAALQEVDLKEDLENTLKIFGHRLKSGIQVIREYDPAMPRVCAYGGELNQVWTNLFDNAIDAMNGKGELRVRTLRELDCAIVEIGDNGTGIPPEIQSRIFEPFFTTKGVGKGTGLGLDTLMRIVRRHHGAVDVKSQPGDTCFRVRLPFKQPKVHAVESEPQTS